MNQKNKNNSRTAFIKKFTLAFISFAGIGLLGNKFQGFQKFIAGSSKPISEHEANRLILKTSASNQKRIKPEPPPKLEQKPEGLK